MVHFLDLYYLKLWLVQSSAKSGHVLEISLFIWKLFDLKVGNACGDEDVYYHDHGAAIQATFILDS